MENRKEIQTKRILLQDISSCIPLNPPLSCVVFDSMVFGTSVCETSLSVASRFEEGPATSATNDDTRSLFKLTLEITPSAA